MEVIPKESQANLKNGSWLIYQDKENTIQIWCSNLSGMEKVYLNSELISKKRNLKGNSSHVFSDKDGANYDVHFSVENCLKGEIVCQITCEEDLLKTFKLKLQKDNSLPTFKRILPFLLASLIFGFLMGTYDLSYYAFGVFLTSMFLISFLTTEKVTQVIEE